MHQSHIRYFECVSLALALFITQSITVFGAGFSGSPEIKMLDNGRDIKLLKEFRFYDSTGLIWSVPSGTTVNGASIPRPLWSVVGGPLTGKYRRSSIIHDYFCDIQTRPAYMVHRAFYEAVLSEGLGLQKARSMLAAVVFLGPQWSVEEPLDKQVKEAHAKFVSCINSKYGVSPDIFLRYLASCTQVAQSTNVSWWIQFSPFGSLLSLCTAYEALLKDRNILITFGKKLLLGSRYDFVGSFLREKEWQDLLNCR